MIKLIKATYLTQRFFIILTLLSLLYFFSYFLGILYILSFIAFIAFCSILAIDFLMLFLKKSIEGKRNVPEKLSNGDENQIEIFLTNNYNFKSFVEIIDEIPQVFQIRDFLIKLEIDAKQTTSVHYSLIPKKRGEYNFGKLNIFASTIFGLLQRRYVFDVGAVAKVYPAFLSMKTYEFKAISNRLQDLGIKQIRRLGHTMEFEQIRNYIRGDDYRTINWKATARKNEIMVNQYEDERSQPVYSIIDMGRNMKMPFAGMTLLDYAINSSLILSRIAMLKRDKAGLITFNENIQTSIPAGNRPEQMNKILESLYNQTTGFLEPNYEQLNSFVKLKINQRALIILYTNFESLNGMSRNFKYLQSISKSHLLLVVFFKNSELFDIINNKAENIKQVYNKIIAEQFAFEKRSIVQELKKYGILSILTAPEDLNIQVINKYLEIKARRLI
jgi:uncharacterized protein (DUF58 family)